MAKVFNQIAGNNPGYSVFDLSHRRTLTADMGQLIPIFLQECVPGDHFKLGNEVIVRMQPLIAPVLHKIDAYIHYFFVPYRLLWDDWENFITGGQDGLFNTPQPLRGSLAGLTNEGTLWDYFGFPTGVGDSNFTFQVVDFPWRAYWFIWNEYYRDQNFQTEVNYEVTSTPNTPGLRNWGKDYFTSALPSQVRGPAPALPVSGLTSAVYPVSNFAESTGGENLRINTGVNTNFIASLPTSKQKAVFDNNTVDLSNATSVTISELRFSIQLQRWLELNMRAGVRYTEFLQAHYGVSPKDSRLQRPEYIGGMKSPVIISEVLQTSSTDATTPQANMSGHGITVDREFCGKYRVQEFGLIMGLLSVMPEPMYQQGINRQWTRATRYDYYNPAFAHLSEQAILGKEIYAKTGTDVYNNAIWGYQGRYDELRYVPSTVHGKMRSTFNYWHFGRIFAAEPALGDTFLKCDATKRPFAVQLQDEPSNRTDRK
jgi:hypothetical protein